MQAAELEVTDRPRAQDLASILAPSALAFLAELHERFDARRLTLLADRARRRAALRDGATLDFLPDTAAIREDDWTVATPRPDYADRRAEITGPVDRKMMINALNSGARGFMVDFEDATAPAWENVVRGQRNVADAVAGTISYDGSDGREYRVVDDPATLVVRPRGWHLPERHLRAHGSRLSGSLVDFGLFAFHCAAQLLERGSAPYLYLPKLEHHLEARLWNDVFTFSEGWLGLATGSIRATVLIETLPAAFQMDEILWELRDHSYGLNAGRWDYIFSTIKTFPGRREFLLPDRSAVTMTVPFMRAYTELLVKTCHRRGTFAMGGMAALIPSRTDPAANARTLAAVGEDKRREAGAGFDGTWVAHPDLVEVATAEFDRVLGDRPNQISRQRPEVETDAAALLDIAATPGEITEQGLRNDVSVGFRYISFWLGGRGAAAIDGLMEDAATAEICRSQIWQWIDLQAQLDDGRTVTRELVATILGEEMERTRAAVGEEVWAAGHPDRARELFETGALGEDFPEFLTLGAYESLE